MGWWCILDQNLVWLGVCRKEDVLHAGARTMVERTCSEFNCGSCRAVAPLRQKATPPWVTTAVAVVSGPNEEAVDGDGCGSALLPSSAQHDLILDSDFRVGRINRIGWFCVQAKIGSVGSCITYCSLEDLITCVCLFEINACAKQSCAIRKLRYPDYFILFQPKKNYHNPSGAIQSCVKLWGLDAFSGFNS